MSGAAPRRRTARSSGRTKGGEGHRLYELTMTGSRPTRFANEVTSPGGWSPFGTEAPNAVGEAPARAGATASHAVRIAANKQGKRREKSGDWRPACGRFEGE